MNTPALKALLVEDDTRLAELTREYLQKHGIAVHVEHDGVRGLEIALSGEHDVLLLDLMLPGIDGLELCRRVRERRDIPILMLTARGEEADLVLGLEMGADDYISKPFSPRELLARLQAAVRRFRGLLGPTRSLLSIQGLALDPERRRCELDGEYLELTSYEFAILYELAKRPGRVLGREQLMELAGGSPEESFDRSIDVHVSKLRHKLGDDPKRPRFIKTVRGVGYLFVGDRP
jgi:two-component system OmpR family response regulator